MVVDCDQLQVATSKCMTKVMTTATNEIMKKKIYGEIISFRQLEFRCEFQWKRKTSTVKQQILNCI